MERDGGVGDTPTINIDDEIGPYPRFNVNTNSCWRCCVQTFEKGVKQLHLYLGISCTRHTDGTCSRFVLSRGRGTKVDNLDPEGSPFSLGVALVEDTLASCLYQVVLWATVVGSLVYLTATLAWQRDAHHSLTSHHAVSSPVYP